MYESYIKEVPILDLKEDEREMTIIKSILESQKKLELANTNFQYARGDLIDYYTYQIKSEQAKINYLLKQAKDQKIVLDVVKAQRIKQTQIALNET